MLILDREIDRIISNNRTRFIASRIAHSEEVAEIYVTHDPARDVYVIRSKVVERDQHICYIEIDSQNKVIYYDCQCYFCDSLSACAHVGATLYLLQELSPNNFPFHYKNDVIERQEARRQAWLEHQKKIEIERRRQLAISRQNESREFIHSFFPSIEIPKNINNMGLIISGDFNRTAPALKFQVGQKKKYIIKDYRAFLLNIEMKKEVSYGKNLSFVHDYDCFEPESQKIIDFLREISVFPVDQYAYERDKLIYFTEETVDLIYDFLSNLDDRYFDFALLEELKKPTIHFDQEGEFYNVYSSLDMEECEIIIGNKYCYLVNNFALRRIVFDHHDKTFRLFKKLFIEPIYLLEEDKESFNQFVLSDVLDSINIIGMEVSRVNGFEWNRELYVDMDENGDITMVLKTYLEEGVVEGYDVPKDKRSATLQTVINHLDTHSDFKKNGIYYFDSKKEKGYEFVHVHLPMLSPYVDIYVSDAIESLKQAKKVSFQVGITIKNDLLEIDVDSIEIPKDELEAVLETYKRKRKYHKLKNGQVITMESSGLTHLEEMFTKYDVNMKDLHNGKANVPMYRAFSLDEANNSKYLQYNRSKTFKKVMNDLTDANKEELVIKEQYTNVLREYQKTGVQWLYTLQNYHFNGILADDMGLGKTLQAIALLDSHHTGVSLVIAPASLLLNWQDEIQKFAPELRVEVIHGTKQARKHIIHQASNYDIVITSYDYIRRDVDLYQDSSFEYVVLDEAQYIKNPKTKNAQSVKKLNSKHRLVLTGTPIENSLAELWSIFDFLMKGYLYSYSHFQKNFEIPIVKEKNIKVQEELKKLITPFVLRRTKKEVLTELPDKIEKTITIEFNEAQHKLYLANLMQVNENLQTQLKVENVNKIQILSMLTRLRQICCDPRLVYENMDYTSSKMDACLELIDTLKQNNKKILLFSSFTSLLDLLQIELDKRNISYYVLTGSVDKEKRRELVKKFQEDDTTIFLISLKAGGTGLNLTAAEAVIHFDPWWNVSAQNQATDRAHRIGQNNVVEVFKLIMEGSIEQKIAALQVQKKDLADAFVEGNEGSISSMSSQEIIDLFQP